MGLHEQAPPGQPVINEPPRQIKLIGICQLVAGAIYMAGFVVSVLLSCGGALFALTPIYGAIVAGLEIYNGLKAVQDAPNTGKFWWKALPIMGIVSIVSLDFLSCAVGILALVILSKDEVKAWFR